MSLIDQPLYFKKFLMRDLNFWTPIRTCTTFPRRTVRLTSSASSRMNKIFFVNRIAHARSFHETFFRNCIIRKGKTSRVFITFFSTFFPGFVIKSSDGISHKNLMFISVTASSAFFASVTVGNIHCFWGTFEFGFTTSILFILLQRCRVVLVKLNGLKIDFLGNLISGSAAYFQRQIFIAQYKLDGNHFD